MMLTFKWKRGTTRHQTLMALLTMLMQDSTHKLHKVHSGSQIIFVRTFNTLMQARIYMKGKHSIIEIEQDETTAIRILRTWHERRFHHQETQP